MIEYTINDNLNITFGGSDAKHASDDQNSKSFKRPIRKQGSAFKIK